MDLNDASGGLNWFSGFLNSGTTWLSKVLAWMFTFRNMMFFLLIIGIIFIAYKLFEDDVSRKKFNYSRRREI